MPFADHNAILDPTCSDLTARTLELFGYINFDQREASVENAIRYLIATQEDDGSWYGRWGVNYIYGTWQVLRGGQCIGEGMREPWIVRARDWLGRRQKSEGRLGRHGRRLQNVHLQRPRPQPSIADRVGANGPDRRRRSIASGVGRLPKH